MILDEIRLVDMCVRVLFAIVGVRVLMLHVLVVVAGVGVGMAFRAVAVGVRVRCVVRVRFRHDFSFVGVITPIRRAMGGPRRRCGGGRELPVPHALR